MDKLSGEWHLHKNRPVSPIFVLQLNRRQSVHQAFLDVRPAAAF